MKSASIYSHPIWIKIVEKCIIISDQMLIEDLCITGLIVDSCKKPS